MAFVEVSGLAKSYGKLKAVDGISFAIERGHCVALLGPNGAGKTTSLNMLAGLLRPTAGTISFEGLPAGGDRRTLIGYLPQETAIFGWMTGSEYLRMVGELFGLSRADAAKRADELLDTLSLGEAGRRRVGGYSGGMKQRLGLAQALVSKPQLLILDEPVSGLDPVGRRDVLELLKRLKTTTTILFSTHVLPDAEELSDDVLIIRGGSIIVSGTMEALRERYQMPIVEVEFEFKRRCSALARTPRRHRRHGRATWADDPLPLRRTVANAGRRRRDLPPDRRQADLRSPRRNRSDDA